MRSLIPLGFQVILCRVSSVFQLTGMNMQSWHSGRLLGSVRNVPPSLWAHLGKEIGVQSPDVASLKAMYGRTKTLSDHRQLAQETLGFRLPTEHQKRAFLRVLRDEAARLSEKDQLLVFARRWLYDHKLLIDNNRRLRSQIGECPDFCV